MTTIEAAQEYGFLTFDQAKKILKEHGLTFDEAYQELGDSVTDAYQLCLWMGY